LYPRFTIYILWLSSHIPSFSQVTTLTFSTPPKLKESETQFYFIFGTAKDSVFSQFCYLFFFGRQKILLTNSKGTRGAKATKSVHTTPTETIKYKHQHLDKASLNKHTSQTKTPTLIYILWFY
jgi:hypothetical protein